MQVATGDAWYSAIARQLRDDDGSIDKWASCFFTSYMLIVGVVLLNIVVAVLLDEFINTVIKERAESRRAEDEKKAHELVGAPRARTCVTLASDGLVQARAPKSCRAFVK